MPLDAAPDPAGNVWLLRRFFPDGAQMVVHVGKDSTPPMDLHLMADDLFPGAEVEGPFMPHFATCPQADRHRK